MKLQIFLICSLTLCIQSQSLKPTRMYNGYQQHSEQLFFSDNIPTHLKLNNANLQGDLDETQENPQQKQAQQVADDSYLRAQQTQQNLLNQNINQMKILNQPATQNLNQNQNQYPYNNQYLNSNQNKNYEFQPSMEVLPPSHSSQDFYNSRQNFLQNQQKNQIDKFNRFTEVNPVPLTQRNATREDMRKVSLTTSYIGINMMKISSGNQSNVVVSPLSVVNMLALLQAGATGETQRQVSDALGLTPEISPGVFQLMNAEFQKRGAQRNVLKLASSIFAADAFELGTVFKNIAIQNFDSEVSRISFGNPNTAAKKINGWIASKTNNQIDKLVSPDSIDLNTQLVLANAIYFKGLWETMFKPESTANKEFNLSNGQKKSVPFMSLRSGFKCGFDKSVNSLVVVLPFEGEQYSLVMLLPQPNATIQGVLESLNGEKLADYQNFRVKDAFLEIPKFTVRANTDLYPIFNMMGITKMFSPASELTNIGLYRTTSPQVSSAVHSAMMSIDERGATAAASTVVAVVALSYDIPSLVFRANRPFLAVLWDNQLNVPLFMTKIEDPSL